jgi:hypothetical protein
MAVWVPKREIKCVTKLALAFPYIGCRAIGKVLEEGEAVMFVDDAAEDQWAHCLIFSSVSEEAHQLNTLASGQTIALNKVP